MRGTSTCTAVYQRQKLPRPLSEQSKKRNTISAQSSLADHSGCLVNKQRQCASAAGCWHISESESCSTHKHGRADLRGRAATSQAAAEAGEKRQEDLLFVSGDEKAARRMHRHERRGGRAESSSSARVDDRARRGAAARPRARETFGRIGRDASASDARANGPTATGEAACADLIEAHRRCLRLEGFNV